jgi:hypothetical protein
VGSIYQNIMADIFISYSRKDKPFVQTLHVALGQADYDVWVDWEDIPLTSDWWDEIQRGIESAHSFIFVISPDSIASKVCRRELDHAVKTRKRLIPLVWREGFDEEEGKAPRADWLCDSGNYTLYRDRSWHSDAASPPATYRFGEIALISERSDIANCLYKNETSGTK